MRKEKLASYFLVTALAATLFGCNRNNNNSSGGNNNNYKDLASIGNVVDDLERGDNGEFVVDYLDNVQIEMWSVIGAPDQTTLLDLVREFNREYAGMIEIKVKSVGHYDYYNALDSTYANDRENFPDVCLMHNEKNIEYGLKQYFYPLDELIEKSGVDINFENVYSNIERTTLYNNQHLGIPIDAHGYLTQFRQDIIKKNNLGFDNNTRYIPNSYAEYDKLLNDLSSLAKSGELYTRNINLDQDHSWYKLKDGNSKLSDSVEVKQNLFRPTFDLYAEADALTALYVNGGSLLDGDGKVAFHKNEGFVKYVTDQVNRYNSDIMGAAEEEKVEKFGKGSTVMFSEGPWWIANTYDMLWNNNQLKAAGERGVSVEDAADPVYSQPYVAARPHEWWSAESAPAETKSKWYGNGHVLAITSEVTSMKKVAAALEFVRWFTQAQNDKGDYYLTKWCKAGHIPAWKNVYDSTSYQTAKENSMTLKALGDPKDIIALESAEYATQLISGVITSVTNVHAKLQSENGCTIEQAKTTITEVANSTQQALDLLNIGF